jgi:xylose isomerase
MAKTHLSKFERVSYEGSGTTNPLAFKHYNPAEIVTAGR